MTDYKLLADNDPGGDLETAYTAMSSETETVAKDVDGRMINERRIFALIGMTSGEALMSSIDNDATIPSRVKAWFKPSEQGVDINDISVQTVLTAKQVEGVITAEELTALVGYGSEEVAKYPGLKIGQLEHARRMRANGEV